jgi:hypothetical protein
VSGCLLLTSIEAHGCVHVPLLQLGAMCLLAMRVLLYGS